MLNIMLFCIGACLASFFNVVIERIHYNQSFFIQRSKCNHCQQILPFYCLCPILSALILKHRCLFCYSRFPYYYTLTEIIWGFLMIYIYHHYYSVELLWIFIFSCLMYFSFMADLLYYELYTWLFICLSLCFLLIGFIYCHLELNLSQLVIYLLIVTLLYPFYKHSLGVGDIIFFALYVIIYPFAYLPLIVFIATLLGLVTYCLLHIYNYQIKFLPFIPFLITSELCFEIFFHA